MWYSNSAQIIALIVGVLTMVVCLASILCSLVEEEHHPVMFILSLIICISSMVYVTFAQNKENEVILDKYKYTVKTIQGKSSDIHYTNYYEIKDGVIYFDGKCSNNFTVKVN